MHKHLHIFWGSLSKRGLSLRSFLHTLSLERKLGACWRGQPQSTVTQRHGEVFYSNMWCSRKRKGGKRTRRTRSIWFQVLKKLWAGIDRYWMRYQHFYMLLLGEPRPLLAYQHYQYSFLPSLNRGRLAEPHRSTPMLTKCGCSNKSYRRTACSHRLAICSVSLFVIAAAVCDRVCFVLYNQNGSIKLRTLALADSRYSLERIFGQSPTQIFPPKWKEHGVSPVSGTMFYHGNSYRNGWQVQDIQRFSK